MNSPKVASRVILGNLWPFNHLLYFSLACPKQSIRTWIRQLRHDIPESRGRIAIFALRNYTWIEWAIYTACWMRKLGLAPILIYSGDEIRSLYGRKARGFLYRGLFFGDILKEAANIPDIILLDIDSELHTQSSDTDNYNSFSDEYAYTTAAYELRVEEYENGVLGSEYEGARIREKERLAVWGATLERLFKNLKDKKIDRAIAYSGTIGVTSAIGEAAKRAEMDIIFVEGWAVKPGHMFCNINGPAFDFNVLSWLDSISDWDKYDDEQIAKYLQYQEGIEPRDSGWLVSYHKFQRASIKEKLPEKIERFIKGIDPIFLLGSNVIGDSATLRRRAIFRNQRDWLKKTCEFFIEHPNLKLIVRAHPDEKFLGSKVVIKTGDIAEEAAGGVANILVIKGDEDINIFSLAPFARAGLVWLSTVGVDLVVRGCPVIAAAQAKYSGLGIVGEPESQIEYFSSIIDFVKVKRCPAPEQINIGKKYLAVLSQEFSYDSFSHSYRAKDIDLTDNSVNGDRAIFYRILSGELEIGKRPPTREKK